MGVGGKAGADNPDPLESARPDQLPAKQKGLDDGVAQIGQFVRGPAQIGGAQLHQAAILDGSPGDQRGATAEHVDIAGELARMMHRDLVRLTPGMLHDLDGSVDHHEEGAIAFTLGEQGVTGVHLTRLAARGEGSDVSGAENGKGDVEIGHKKIP